MGLVDRLKKKVADATVNKVAGPMNAAGELAKLEKEGPANALQYGEYQKKLDDARRRMRGGK